MKTYKKCNSREQSLIDTQAWNEGDTKELKKWLGWSYERHYFVNNNGVVDLFYEEKDGDKFYNIVEEKLKEEDFLDKIIEYFINQVNKGREIFKKEPSKEDITELYNITVRCWPGTSIFDLISNYPEVVFNNEEIINKLLKIRNKYGEFMYEVSDIILKTISKIFPEVKDFADFITIQEFINEKIPEKEELEKRKKYYTLYSHFLETDLSFKGISKEHEFFIVERVLDKTNEVRGNIAMRGKARGIVKVIFKIEDINKVETGSILIATMTTPDFIIAMDKASAFVTDEGGIACHAAIVAREFGKPCIVGTENATKIFRDGDLVFVDADEGVVKKIAG